MYLTLESNYSISLHESESDDIVWKREVIFKDPYKDGKRTLTIASAIPHTPYIIPPPKHRFQTSVLKSNLQKAVRRGNVMAAVATAQQIASQGHEDQIELFRRLPIILLEDTLLNTHILPRWIWWMLATSKGWCLSQKEWNVLFADITCIASDELSRWRDRLHKEESAVPIEEILGSSSHNWTQKLGIFMIWIRSQWGGMSGDMAWLRGLAMDWYTRSRDMWHFRHVFNYPITLKGDPTFPTFDVAIHALPEAVDFHCCPAMLADFAKEHGVSEQEVKEAIWWNRSEFNTRYWIDMVESDPPPHQELFRKLTFEKYVRRMWKPLPPQSRQTSLFAYIGSKPTSHETD